MRALKVTSRLIVLPSQYNLESLSELALSKFIRRANEDWAKPEFADAVNLIYAAATAGESSLRKAAVNIILRHYKILSKEESGSKIREVIGTVPELGLDLFACFSQAPPNKMPGHLAVCPVAACGMIWKTTLSNGILYQCPHCSRSYDGSSLIERRTMADKLLLQMHAHGV